MANQSPDGSSLPDLLRSNDPEDWKRLLEGINPAPLLVRIEHRIGPALRGQVTPEDIWQGTLLYAWRNRARFDSRGLRGLRAWLMEIAESLIRDAVERQQAQKRDAGREVSLSRASGTGSTVGSAFDPPSPSKTPSSLAAHAELAGMMREALEGLPEIYREVLRLRLFEELDREDIAQQLGLSMAAVKHRIRLGAALYRDRLAFARSTRAQAEGERRGS